MATRAQIGMRLHEFGLRVVEATVHKRLQLLVGDMLVFGPRYFAPKRTRQWSLFSHKALPTWNGAQRGGRLATGSSFPSSHGLFQPFRRLLDGHHAQIDHLLRSEEHTSE